MLYIYWFRKDLRITDNRGLNEFVKKVSNENKFSFLYIKNKNSFQYFGEKRISFLIECLNELKSDLSLWKLTLNILEGKSKDVFNKIIGEHKQITVFCNEQVEPYCIERDNEVKKIVTGSDGSFNSFSDTTIFNIGDIKNGEGNQYKVYTPFKNQCLGVLNQSHYKKAEVDLNCLNIKNEVVLNTIQKNDSGNYSVADKSDFIKGGRKEGLSLLKSFYEKGLSDYKSKRDFPSINGTSFLSSHLHFGTVGIREALRTAFSKLKKVKGKNAEPEVQTWINELLWREFYYNITFHNPRITYESFNKEYDNLKWNYNEEHFDKWCKGLTGYPIVDAGMRQLNKEGWMHNRVRMITAMFLTKDLFFNWRYGEKYFADKLIDMDFSNNNGGWQWSASTGVDAQPYFRIFNPVLQSKKFDPDGIYIKAYVDELKHVPVEYIHEPHLMSGKEQKKYGVIIGKDYPAPIVDHMKAKELALESFGEL